MSHVFAPKVRHRSVITQWMLCEAWCPRPAKSRFSVGWVLRSEFCEEHLPQSSSIQWLLTVGSVGKNDQKCSYHLFARIQLQEAVLAGCEKEVGSCWEEFWWKIGNQRGRLLRLAKSQHRVNCFANPAAVQKGVLWHRVYCLSPFPAEVQLVVDLCLQGVAQVWDFGWKIQKSQYIDSEAGWMRWQPVRTNHQVSHREKFKFSSILQPLHA